MNLTGNTILITGGGSGIGRALAESFQALGNKVIIAGRRKSVLDDVTAGNPEISSLVLDIEDPAAIRAFAGEVISKFPDLNVLINNAGIMRREKLAEGETSDAEAIVTTNLLGPIRLTAALLPHLLKQARPAVMNVSSGLAFVPLAPTPAYCATKAAIHSWTQSLRYQMKDSSLTVMELIPPYVQTDLMSGASDPRAMPLRDYIAEVMNILKTQPDALEICVERVKGLRFAAESGKYDLVFKTLNDAMSNVE